MASMIERFIASEISKAMSRHGLSFDSPVRRELEASAEIAGSHDAIVRVRNGDRSMNLDDFIEELRGHSQFRAYFPPEPPRVSRKDEAKIRANFAEIASGQVIVE
jgi:hypothetical protein